MKNRIPTTDELARPKVQVARRVLERFEHRLARMEGKDSLAIDDGTQASEATTWLACALLALQGRDIDGADDLVVEVERQVQDEIERSQS